MCNYNLSPLTVATKCDIKGVTVESKCDMAASPRILRCLPACQTLSLVTCGLPHFCTYNPHLKSVKTEGHCRADCVQVQLHDDTISTAVCKFTPHYYKDLLCSVDSHRENDNRVQFAQHYHFHCYWYWLLWLAHVRFTRISDLLVPSGKLASVSVASCLRPNHFKKYISQ